MRQKGGLPGPPPGSSPSRILRRPGGLPIQAQRYCPGRLRPELLSSPFLRVSRSTYEKFLQTAGLQDGASHCVKNLSSMYAALNSNPSDPDIIINLDISNAFNVLCRQLTLNVMAQRLSVFHHHGATCAFSCILDNCRSSASCVMRTQGHSGCECPSA